MNQNLGIFLIVQSLSQKNTSAVVSLDHGNYPGRIWIRGGQLIHAESPHCLDESILMQAYHILASDGGRLSIETFYPPPEETLALDLENMAISVARLMDEALETHQIESRLREDLSGGNCGYATQRLTNATLPIDTEVIQPIYLVNDRLFSQPVVLSGNKILGRARECDIIVIDGSVSKRHCLFLYHLGKLCVRDLGTQNGTYLNGRRVEEAALSHHDILGVGGVDFTVLFALPLSSQAGAQVG